MALVGGKEFSQINSFHDEGKGCMGGTEEVRKIKLRGCGGRIIRYELSLPLKLLGRNLAVSHEQSQNSPSGFHNSYMLYEFGQSPIPP